MRQVQLREEDKKITFVDQVLDQKYYGLLINDNRYFLMKKDKNHYKIIDPNYILNSSFDSHNGHCDNLSAVLEFWIKSYAYEVFEFNTSKELFKWLSE